MRLPILCSLHIELEDYVRTGSASRNDWHKCHVPMSRMEKSAVSNKQDSDLSLSTQSSPMISFQTNSTKFAFYGMGYFATSLIWSKIFPWLWSCYLAFLVCLYKDTTLNAVWFLYIFTFNCVRISQEYTYVRSNPTPIAIHTTLHAHPP